MQNLKFVPPCLSAVKDTGPGTETEKDRELAKVIDSLFCWHRRAILKGTCCERVLLFSPERVWLFHNPAQ